MGLADDCWFFAFIPLLSSEDGIQPSTLWGSKTVVAHTQSSHSVECICQHAIACISQVSQSVGLGNATSRVCVCGCVRARARVCVSMCVVCAHACMCVCVRAHVHVRKYVCCVCTHVHVCVCVCAFSLLLSTKVGERRLYRSGCKQLICSGHQNVYSE